MTLPEVAQDRKTDTCLWAVPKVCCIKVHWAEMQFHLVCVSWLYYFLLPSVQQDLCINFNFGLLETEHLAGGDYCRVMVKFTGTCLSKGTVFVLWIFRPLTKEDTLSVKVKAGLVSRVQYHYPNPSYRHSRPLQTSVLNCKSRFNYIGDL